MEIKQISELIKTQDDRITDQPIFVVEKSVMIPTCGDFCYDDEEWAETQSGDYCRADETKSRRLDALKEGYRDTGKWEKFYLKETWAFVTACFTEQGCKDFLKCDGHNLGKTRIYAYGSYRNHEFQALRNMLIEQTADTAT